MLNEIRVFIIQMRTIVMIQKVNLRLVNRLFLNHQTRKFRILKIPKRFQKGMKIAFNRIMQQALQLQLKLLGSFGP